MILLALAIVASAPAPARPLPLPVRRFIERRDGCDHWRGEYSEDPPRRRQIERGVREACTGTDRELKRLRVVYRRDRRVLAALKGYERVEF